MLAGVGKRARTAKEAGLFTSLQIYNHVRILIGIIRKKGRGVGGIGSFLGFGGFVVRCANSLGRQAVLVKKSKQPPNRKTMRPQALLAQTRKQLTKKQTKNGSF